MEKKKQQYRNKEADCGGEQNSAPFSLEKIHHKEKTVIFHIRFQFPFFWLIGQLYPDFINIDASRRDFNILWKKHRRLPVFGRRRSAVDFNGAGRDWNPADNVPARPRTAV